LRKIDKVAAVRRSDGESEEFILTVTLEGDRSQDLGKSIVRKQDVTAWARFLEAIFSDQS
jgi:hypothetical protein